MAGIGFELRRVIAQGGNLSKTLRAVVSGVFIVAGPWFLSILTIFAVNWWYASSADGGTAALFQSIVTYTYAVSLILFSPVQYFFVRLMSDLVWNDRVGEATWFLGRLFAVVSLASMAVTWVVLGFLPPERLDGAVRLVWALFAGSVNGLWVVMLFITVLKWFGRILGVYLGGLAVCALLAWGWGPLAGVSGALGSLTAANGLIAAGLLVLSFRSHPSRRPETPWAMAAGTLGKNAALVLGGLLFTLGLWVDKAFFWVWSGSSVAGTFLRAYPPYDMVVYQAGLTVVPGLVYFIIVTETRFASGVTQFIQALSSQPYWKIRRLQFQLSRVIRAEWTGLAAFQALVAGAVFLGSGMVTGLFDPRMAVGLAGVGVQLLLMVCLTFFFYLELYRDAAWISGLFFGAGVAGCFLQAAFPDILPGVGYLGSTVLATAAGMVVLGCRIRSIDRILFNHW